MHSSYPTNVKYIDFSHLILLSWHICNASIVDLVKLSTIVTPCKLHKVITVSEFFILSTCNRIEIYIYSTTPREILEQTKQFISKEYPNSKNIYNPCEYLEGLQVYIHLAKVTSGLNSLAIGEYQIQGQVKASYKNAISNKYIGRYLIPLIESALRTGKRVRSETSITHKSASLSSLAIDIILQVNKPKQELPILIVGTGKMCNLAAEYFVQMGYKTIIFFSNEPDKRETIRMKYKALVLPISELTEKNKENNIIFSAVSTDTPRIYLKSLERNRSKFSIIDLSIPKYILGSDIDTSYSYLLDMEGIQKIAPDYLPDSQSEINKCEYIIHEEINRFVLDNKRRRALNISQSNI